MKVTMRNERENTIQWKNETKKLSFEYQLMSVFCVWKFYYKFIFDAYKLFKPLATLLQNIGDLLFKEHNFWLTSRKY